MRNNDNQIRFSILSTLAFYDLFEFPLTNLEIYDNLWQTQCEIQDCLRILTELVKQKKIYRLQGFFGLAGRESLVNMRKKRYLSSYHKWRMIEKYRWVWASVPFIKMIGVSNTLGYGNAKEKGDIDLLVITKKNRLFTVRLFLTFWLLILGKWRHGKNIANRFCLSFYTTEKFIDFQRLMMNKNDIYLIYWLKWLRPIWSTDINLAERWWKKNKWVENYLPNTMMVNPVLQIDHLNWWGKFTEKILLGFWGDWFESFLAEMQLKKIKKKTPVDNIDGAMASKDILKFHPEGKRREYARKWQKIVKEIN